MTKRITSQVIKALHLPESRSRKGDNGRLLIIAGSQKYHGSLIYALKAASKIVDLIYVLTTRENQRLVGKLKEQTAEFIPLTWPAVTLSLEGRGIKCNCVLIGPGMETSRRTYNLVKEVLKSRIKAVLDADALKVLDGKLLRLLNRNHILTPHAGEFRNSFGLPANAKNVEKVVRSYHCNVVLKGKVDIVGVYQFHGIGKQKKTGAKVGYNDTGNAGMTKGGTGDVLAGLIAGFYCRNEAFVSAAAGVYLNGRAGDELYKTVGPFYNAEDLAEEIPRTLYRVIANEVKQSH